MTAKIKFPIRLPTIRVEQPFGEFYLTRMRAGLLKEVAFSEKAHATLEDGDETYKIGGVERLDREKRKKQIGAFIDSDECTFPNSVILAANYTPQGLLDPDDERVWRISSEGELTWLTIPTAEDVAAIVDGQHRILGFDYATRSDWEDIELPCSVFLDLPLAFQSFVFATVNFNQQKVSRGLAFEHFGFDVADEPPEEWSPDKAAVFICRRLNVDADSPFHGRIKIAAQDDTRLLRAKGEERPCVSAATVVDGVLRLISTNPLRDRATIYRSGGSRNRNVLQPDKAPLRTLYLESNDLAVFTIVRNFFAAAQETWWETAKPSSMITKTVGIQASFEVLRDLSWEALSSKKIGKSFFERFISQAGGIDFSDNFFQASGKGRTRIKNEILLAMKRKELGELPEDDRGDYARILRTGR